MKQTLYLAIGWIVVVGFGATVIMTLFGLVGYLRIPERYFRKLFVLVLVELVGCGFFMFQQFSTTQLTFQPQIGMETYLFGLAGEPLPETKLLLDEETKRVFNNNTPEGFDNALAIEVGPKGLIVKSEESGFRYGSIGFDHLGGQVLDELTPVSRHLALGLHYTDCVDERPDPGDVPQGQAALPCQHRRNLSLGISHLRQVLQSPEQSDSAGRRDASRRLYNVKQHLTDHDDFLLIVNAINEHSGVPIRHAEIGDLYHSIALYSDVERDRLPEYRLNALKNLLLYLGSPYVVPDTDVFNRVASQATALAQHLCDATSSEAGPLANAIGNRNVPLLNAAARGEERQAVCLVPAQIESEATN